MPWTEKARQGRHPYVSDDAYMARLKSKCTIDENGCWLYNGFRDACGYGEMSYRGEGIATHRLAYKLAIGPLPEYDGKKQNAIVCHKCDKPACCNPEHLFLGSQRDNMLDARNKKRWAKQRKTHCKRGHEYTTENTAVRTNDKGHSMRQCLICEKERHRRERLENPEAPRQRQRNYRAKVRARTASSAGAARE